MNLTLTVNVSSGGGSGASAQVGSGSGSAKTGDGFNMTGWMIALLTSALFAAALLVWQRKRQKTKA